MIKSNTALSGQCHHVVMVGFDDAQIIDIAGTLEVFSRAGRWLRDTGMTHDVPYHVELVADKPGALRCSSGLQMIASRSYREITAVDTLLVSGGIGYHNACRDNTLLSWLRDMYFKTNRVGSVCTGAFVLGSAGLLDDQSVTTHWAYCERLAQTVPRAQVLPNAIFIQSGKLYTSGGVTAGMDMALALVALDWGQSVALAVAQELVLFLHRSGGQSQFSRYLAAQSSENEKFRALQMWILDHFEEDLSLALLASRVSMSVRSFERHFTAEVGVTPGRFVLEVRVAQARQRLESTELPLEKIAIQCGFSNTESMRRAFIRTLHLSPKAYRSRFQMHRCKDRNSPVDRE